MLVHHCFLLKGEYVNNVQANVILEMAIVMETPKNSSSQIICNILYKIVRNKFKNMSQLLMDYNLTEKMVIAGLSSECQKICFFIRILLDISIVFSRIT